MTRHGPFNPPPGSLQAWPSGDGGGELRSSRRLGLRQPCKVIVPGDGSTRLCELRDLSSDGLSFMSPRPISPRTRLRVEFELTIGDQTLAVAAFGVASYSSFQGTEGFRIGFRFVELDESLRQAISAFVAQARGDSATRPAPFDDTRR